MSYYRRGVAEPPLNCIPFRDVIQEKKEEAEEKVDTVFFYARLIARIEAAFKKR